MKKLKRIVKWIAIVIFSIVAIGILYIRMTRKVDKMMFQASNFEKYEKFESKFNYEENFVTVDKNVELHTVLFKPDSIQPIATIFHCLGKGGNLMNTPTSYKPFLDKGFQIFSFEYREIGLSTGKSLNTNTLKEDVLYLFDNMLKNPSVSNKPILIWGRSMGSAFATMTAKERQEHINGLVLEGAFSSFPDIAKYYAEFMHLEKFRWMVPLFMNNDFPAEQEIKYIHKPIVIIHSTEDKAVPFYLGKKLFDASNKSTTRFWEIKGEHIEGLKLHQKKYVNTFIEMIKK